MKKGLKILALGVAALGIGSVGLAGCGTSETVENITLADFTAYQATDGLSNTFENYTISLAGSDSDGTYALDGHCTIAENGDIKLAFTYNQTFTASEGYTYSLECYIDSTDGIYINNGETKTYYALDYEADSSDTDYLVCCMYSLVIEALSSKIEGYGYSSIGDTINEFIAELSEELPMTKTTKSGSTTYKLVLEDYTDADGITGDGSLIATYDENNQLTYFYTDSSYTTTSGDETYLLEITQSTEDVSAPTDINDYVDASGSSSEEETETEEVA